MIAVKTGEASREARKGDGDGEEGSEEEGSEEESTEEEGSEEESTEEESSKEKSSEEEVGKQRVLEWISGSPSWRPRNLLVFTGTLERLP